MSIMAPEDEAWTRPSMMLWNSFFSVMAVASVLDSSLSLTLGRPTRPVDSRPARLSCGTSEADMLRTEQSLDEEATWRSIRWRH